MKRPPPRAPSDDKNELGEAMNIADDAIRGICTSPSVWAEEKARLDAEPLPWPLAGAGGSYNRLLRMLVVATVQNMVEARAKFLQRAPRMPEGPEVLSPDFQLILRIARRAVDAAAAALAQRFGSGEKLGGKRNFVNWLLAYQIRRLLASAPGTSVTDAAAALGVGKSSAYRALGR